MNVVDVDRVKLLINICGTEYCVARQTCHGHVEWFISQALETTYVVDK